MCNSRKLASPETRYLPQDFVPHDFDVVCGRGIKNAKHHGNQRFRSFIVSNLDRYSAANTNVAKYDIVTSIIKATREGGCRFVRFDDRTGEWHELEEIEVEEKVRHALRDAKLAKKKRSLKKAKEDRAIFEELLHMQRELFLQSLNEKEATALLITYFARKVKSAISREHGEEVMTDYSSLRTRFLRHDVGDVVSTYFAHGHERRISIEQDRPQQ